MNIFGKFWNWVVLDANWSAFRASLKAESPLAMEADTQKDIEADLYDRARRTVKQMGELDWPQKRLENGDGISMNAWRHIRSLKGDR